MPRGGHREGAGRKPGSVNALTEKTREIIERAGAEGVLPLQVMFDNLRLYTKQANELIAKLMAGGVSDKAVGGDELHEPHANVIEAIGEVVPPSGGGIEPRVGVFRPVRAREAQGDCRATDPQLGHVTALAAGTMLNAWPMKI